MVQLLQKQVTTDWGTFAVVFSRESLLVRQILWCHTKQKSSNEAAGNNNVLFHECLGLKKKKGNMVGFQSQMHAIYKIYEQDFQQ